MSAAAGGNRTALVTGASRGLGKAVALELARRGADVVVNYARTQAGAEDTVAQIVAMGRRSVAVQANVGDPDEVVRLCAATHEFGGGRLDVLVHNAAIGTFKPALKLRANQFDLSMNVNARALLLLSQGLRSDLQAASGCIVAMTSAGSSRVLPDYAAVGVSKAALEALVRYLAAELGRDGVRVNALCAGLVETDAFRAFNDGPQRKAEAIARSALGRLATPEEVARAVAMLCSDDAAFIVGQVVVADGGAGLR